MTAGSESQTQHTSDPGAIGRLVISIVAMVAAMGVGLGELWTVLHEQWTRMYGPNEHGYLVLVMGIWIAIRQWRESPVWTFTPAVVPLVLLGLCVGVLFLMDALDMRLAKIILLPLFVLFTVGAVLGWQAARRLFWGTMFIYFALPQWGIINGALQSITVFAVSTMLRWTGVPAYLEGNVVDIPAGTFEIASGCSGLNYLMAGTALAAFVALTQLENWRERLMLVGIAAVGAVVFNWIRVYIVIVVGHLSDMQHYLVRIEHHTFGWVLFLLLIVPLILLALRASTMPDDRTPGRPTAGQIGSRLSVSWSAVAMTMPVALVLLTPLALG